MSWFEVEEVGDEIAPGVVVERRAILSLPLALAGGVAFGALAPLAAQEQKRSGEAQDEKPAGRRKKPKPKPFEPLSFDQLVDELQPLAEGIIASEKPNEEAYLNSVASMLQRLKLDKIPRRVRQRPLAIIQLRLGKNGAIPYHDHRNYNGVILGLEGEMRIRNYEILGDNLTPPKGEDFKIRETIDQRITPGRVSTLARERDNIHDLRAGEEGGRVLDVFTFFGKGAGSHYLTVDDKPADSKKRIYTARWRQR